LPSRQRCTRLVSVMGRSPLHDVLLMPYRNITEILA
jgi:hypothetical protein